MEVIILHVLAGIIFNSNRLKVFSLRLKKDKDTFFFPPLLLLTVLPSKYRNGGWWGEAPRLKRKSKIILISLWHDYLYRTFN